MSAVDELEAAVGRFNVALRDASDKQRFLMEQSGEPEKALQLSEQASKRRKRATFEADIRAATAALDRATALLETRMIAIE